MARLKLFIPLIIFTALAAIFYMMLSPEKNYNPQNLPSALIGQELPDFSLSQLDGEKILTQSSLIGEPMLLNVWATWCVTCRIEHPFLNTLKEQGVKIVGLDYKDKRPKAIKWLQDLGNPYAVTLFDGDGKYGLDLGVSGAPETYFIDAMGVIRYKHVGLINDAVWVEKLQSIYQKLLSEVK